MARRNPVNNKAVIVNACKTLLANIQFASIDRAARTIVVTSAAPNDGKTTVAVNLAIAAASSGRNVLLLEGDMRNRSLSRTLGVNAASGLYSVLTDSMPLASAVASTAHRNLSLLDVEPNIPNPSDVIGSKRFSDLLGELRMAYDMVIIDTPPVGAVVDAAMLAALCDGTVFVVRDNSTKRNAAVEALSQLRLAGANILGCVLNGAEQEHGSDYGSYYQRDSAITDSELTPRDIGAPKPAAKPVRRAGGRFKQ